MPRPSSPVHAKASTKCSYLTLENPHHQRQVCIKTWRLEMARRIISARYYICKCRIAAFPRQKPRIDRHAPRHRFKNPFTMSKMRGNPPLPDPGSLRAGSRFSSWRHITAASAQHMARGRPGGASRDRTDDLKLAKLALSQLSYGPVSGSKIGSGGPRRT